MINLKKLFLIIFLLPLLTSCFPAGEVSDNQEFGIHPGQWTIPVAAGENKWMTRAYDSKTAMEGGTNFCAKRSKSVDIISVAAGDDDTAAVLIFSCY